MSIHGRNGLSDPELCSSIQFKSKSDSLLAQLLINKGLARRHFDFMMEVLHNPDFTLEDVTLTSSSDVEEAISEYRRDLVENKYYRTSSDLTLTQSGIPSLVLDLVIDYIISQDGHFLQETYSSKQADASLPMHHNRYINYLNLSLVHRSWVLPVQRAFYRRIILSSRRSLQKFSRSPACSSRSCVREFVYRIKKTETSTFFRGGSTATYEHWSILASVLSRLKTLRFLCLSIEAEYVSELEGFDTVLETIAKLKGLEGLWLLSSRVHNPYFSELCLTLSKLKNLKFLSLCNWNNSIHEQNGADALSLGYDLTPPSTLKYIQYKDVYFTTPPVNFSWLLKPRGSYRIESLELTITFSRQSSLAATNRLRNLNYEHNSFSELESTPASSQALIACLDPLLPYLTFLSVALFYLDTTSFGSFTPLMHDLDIQSLLDRATSLKSARVHRLPSALLSTDATMTSLRVGEINIDSVSFTPSLPQSIEEIHIHYPNNAVNWRLQDRRLRELIHTHSNNKNGKELRYQDFGGKFPQLKRIFVSIEDKLKPGIFSSLYPSHPDSNQEQEESCDLDLPHLLPDTYQLCLNLGIKLIHLSTKADMYKPILDVIP